MAARSKTRVSTKAKVRPARPAKKAATRRAAKKAPARADAGLKARRSASQKTRATPAAAGSAKPKKKSGYELKTKATGVSVDAFVNAIADVRKRADARTIIRMMQDITGEPPKMWGPSIVGFGRYHYKYASGHEGDMCIAGFSPRAAALTMYILPGMEHYGDLMNRLGKHTMGKSCLMVKRLDDVDTNVLREILTTSIEECRRLYPT